MLTFVNLTPHKIDFQFADGTRVEFPSVGVARVDTLEPEMSSIEYDDRQMPVASSTKYGEVQGLPEPKRNTIYIVSQVVLTQPYVVGRTDVVAPATGPKDGAIRFMDGPQKGMIDAVTRWIAA